MHGSLALDSALVRKISKRHFFQGIKNSFYGVTQMGLKPHQNFFQIFFSTNMVARGVQSFCTLEGATDPQIEKKIFEKNFDVVLDPFEFPHERNF